MSQSNVISYPYPVLTSYGDDIIPSLDFDNIDGTISINENKDYALTVTCKLADSTINKLIYDGKAEFMMEVDCKYTFYRRCYRQSSNVFNIILPKEMMAAKTSFSVFVIAKEDFSYTSPNFHPDYNGQSFDIELGDVLVIFNGFGYDFEIEYSKLKAYSSIMNIRKSDDANLTEIKYLFDSSKIVVEMPQKLFDAYNQFKGDPQYIPAMHASVVQNALLAALLQEDWSSEVEDELLWKRTIRYRVAHEDSFKGLNLEDKDNMVLIAQKLLQNPVERMFDGFKQNVTELEG